MSYWINYWLNRGSMYRLVSISLTILLINALVLSIVGILDFSPSAIIVSGGVLVGSVYFSNRLFGLLVGIHTHDESSYITALLLFFIFSPKLTLVGLLALGIAGVIASASKYLLVVHGRHVFNPAAIAAVITGLTGLASATWWVATPLLLPVTLVGAFLILYKTHRLTLGGVFLVIAVPIVLLVLLSYGTPLTQAIALLASWPFLFFIGFMLSEPLTLPPRKWQQLTEAGIVAVLFALPIHIGWFVMTPAIPLVIGNAVAFIFSRRRGLELTLAGHHPLTPTSDEFTFNLNRTAAFEAGQYMEITVPHKNKDMRGVRRIFSITSAPGESFVTFGIKFYDPSSSFKEALRGLPVGATIQATMVSGDFTLPKDPDEPILLIAGGIGITPFISHLLYAQKTRESRDIILIYMINNLDELAYIEIIKQAGIKVFIIAKSSRPLPITSWKLINAPYATREALRDAVPDIRKRRAYVSGPPIMVNNVKELLESLGSKSIKGDYFTGY